MMTTGATAMRNAVGSDLARAVRGQVLSPGDSGWEVARRPWNLSVQQEVRAVVVAEDAEDVAATVRYANRNGLAVAAQPVGHGATTALRDTILLRTGALRGGPDAGRCVTGVAEPRRADHQSVRPP